MRRLIDDRYMEKKIPFFNIYHHNHTLECNGKVVSMRPVIKNIENAINIYML